MIDVRVPTGEDLGLDPWPTGLLHVLSAALAHNRGDIEMLGEESSKAIELFSAAGDPWGVAFSQQVHAEWLMTVGRLGEALELTELATSMMQSIASSWDFAQQQDLAISILIRQDRLDEATRRVDALLAAAEESGNARTMLQALMTALNVDVARRDIRSSRAHFARFDELTVAWPGMPPQLLAWAECARASIALLDGQTDVAESALRRATKHALPTRDHPIMAAVALGIGVLALERNDVAEAMRALDLATAIAGIHDPTSPQVIAIEAAAAASGFERPDGEVPTRRRAVELLQSFAD